MIRLFRIGNLTQSRRVLRQRAAPPPKEDEEQKAYFRGVNRRIVDDAMEAGYVLPETSGDTRAIVLRDQFELRAGPYRELWLEIWKAVNQLEYFTPFHTIHSVPNGGYKGPKARVLFQATGLRAGVFDIEIATGWAEDDDEPHCRRFLGLRLELKRIRGGVISDWQKIWEERYRRSGYLPRYARGADEAWHITTAYFEGRLKEQGGTE